MKRAKSAVMRRIDFIMRRLAHWRFRSGADPHSHPLPQNVIVSGFFGANFGISRAAELTAAILERQGFTVTRHDIRTAIEGWNYFRGTLPGPENAAWVIHANPPEAQALLARTNPARAPCGPRIGYWVWELQKAPPSWLKAAGMFDIILTPSRFSAASLAEVGPKVVVLPHPIANTSKPTPQRRSWSDQSFRFFAQMDGKSSISRKNVTAVIEAFKRARLTEENAELVVKTQNLTHSQEVCIETAIDNCPSIDWITATLEQNEMDQLLESIDCVVSAHRSEGFGLSLAGAALNNQQVLATGWSGNTDFMQDAPETLIPYTLIPIDAEDDVYGEHAGRGLSWAQVNVDQLARSMSRARRGELLSAGLKIKARIQRNEAIWKAVAPGRPFPKAPPPCP